VHSLANLPTDSETECAWRNDAIRGRTLSIRKINSRGIMRYRTSIEELPRFAVRVDRPTADNSRIKEIEPLLAGPVDLTIRFSHQDCLAVMD
jgi:hypothetical protein